MNIAKTLEQYNDESVYFCEPIKNNIMLDSNFIRILYSNHMMTLTGIYLIININELICEKYYNKFKCIFNPNTHVEIIEKLKNIEYKILCKSEIRNKIPQYKINDQLKNGIIKIFYELETKTTTTFLLKISGIWETQYNYGLTYKFIAVQNS